MAKLIIYGFLFYLLYRFITNLVVPVGKATQQMKQQMQEMQNRQEAYQRQQAAEQVTQKSTPTASKGGDYIDFEEVKP
ncbi:MAG: hypothetical protein WCH59_03700 [Chitinophagia bacterium]|jgi:Sec-independent protein translocase protein TatA